MKVLFCVLIILLCEAVKGKKNIEEEEYGVRYATECEGEWRIAYLVVP